MLRVSVRGRTLPARERRFDGAAQMTSKRQQDPLHPANWAVMRYGLLSRLAWSKLEQEEKLTFL